MNVNKAKELLEKVKSKLVEDKFYDIHGDSPGLRDNCPLCLLKLALAALSEPCQTCKGSKKVKVEGSERCAGCNELYPCHSDCPCGTYWKVKPCPACQSKPEQQSGEFVKELRYKGENLKVLAHVKESEDKDVARSWQLCAELFLKAANRIDRLEQDKAKLNDILSANNIELQAKKDGSVTDYAGWANQSYNLVLKLERENKQQAERIKELEQAKKGD